MMNNIENYRIPSASRQSYRNPPHFQQQQQLLQQQYYINPHHQSLDNDRNRNYQSFIQPPTPFNKRLIDSSRS